MSGPAEVIARELAFLDERLASYRRKADSIAARRGDRVAAADDLVERTEQRREDMRATSATVAELVAADRALDEAVKAEGEARRSRGNWNVNPLPHNHPAVLELGAAYERRHAALAKFGGAA